MQFFMPFGKYKGQPVCRVPLSYLAWILETPETTRKYVYIREVIKHEITTRCTPGDATSQEPTRFHLRDVIAEHLRTWCVGEAERAVAAHWLTCVAPELDLTDPRPPSRELAVWHLEGEACTDSAGGVFDLYALTSSPADPPNPNEALQIVSPNWTWCSLHRITLVGLCLRPQTGPLAWRPDWLRLEDRHLTWTQSDRWIPHGVAFYQAPTKEIPTP